MTNQGNISNTDDSGIKKDSKQDDVKTIILHRWKSGMKVKCIVCNKGKFEILESINKCPNCDQKFTVKVQL